MEYLNRWLDNYMGSSCRNTDLEVNLCACVMWLQHLQPLMDSRISQWKVQELPTLPRVSHHFLTYPPVIKHGNWTSEVIHVFPIKAAFVGDAQPAMGCPAPGALNISLKRATNLFSSGVKPRGGINRVFFFSDFLAVHSGVGVTVPFWESWTSPEKVAI